MLLVDLVCYIVNCVLEYGLDIDLNVSNSNIKCLLFGFSDCAIYAAIMLLTELSVRQIPANFPSYDNSVQVPARLCLSMFSHLPIVFMGYW